MRRRSPVHLIYALTGILVLLDAGAIAEAAVPADSAAAALTYETIEPSRIRLGDSATLRVISLDGYPRNIQLPNIPGLTFENLGRAEGVEFINGKPVPSAYIVIRVTPQFTGNFTIPGPTPQARSLGLEVIKGDEPNPYALHGPKQFPQPLPVAPAPLPKGVQLKAGGAAFVQLVIPSRAVYVGESVPVDIEVGVRPGLVTSMNGLPTISGGDFTFNNLSKQPQRREQLIEGSPFVVMTWHSLLAAVKPGDFSLSVETPLSVKINTLSAEDIAIASKMGWPFLQGMYNGIVPKDLKISSPPSALKVLPLPTQGQPRDFSGAVGDFQVASDIAPVHPAAGDPLTLRLHISGSGNFDRVDAAMLDHLDHWKTYPAKSSFAQHDGVGYKGEKTFEQPLIPTVAGEQTLPPLGFSYFNPETRRYEHAQTQPIRVTLGQSLSDSSLTAPRAGTATSGAAAQIVAAFRPDHSLRGRASGGMRPLYFQPAFLTIPTTLALLLAGSWLAVRPGSARAASRSTTRVLELLETEIQSGDVVGFFETARNALRQAFAVRWQQPPGQINPAEFTSRLGPAGDDIQRLWLLADEARYAGYRPSNTELRNWLLVVRAELVGKEH